MFEFPESHSKFPLAICFTYVINFHVTLSIQLTLSLIPSPCVLRSVFYVCFSIAALKKQFMGTIFLDSIYMCQYTIFIFPDSSSGKESTCIAGEASLIPGLGRSTGEGIGYPLKYSWASLVAQLIKNSPVMRETRIWSLGWEDPLEKGNTCSSILAWRIPGTV